MFKIKNRTFEFDQLGSDFVQAQLKQTTHAPGQVKCMCRDYDYLSLVVSRRGRIYYLRSYPNDGVNHDINCRFYRHENEGNAEGQQTPAILYNSDNDSLNININLPLRSANTTDQVIAENLGQNNNNNAVTRASTSLLGMLHRFWNQAGLEYFNPKIDRNFTMTINNRLFRILKNCKIKNKPGDQVVKLINPDRDNPLKKGYLHFKNDIDYPIVIGVLESITSNIIKKYSFEAGGNIDVVVDYELSIKGLSDKIRLSVDCYNQYVDFCNHHAAWQLAGNRLGIDLVIFQYQESEYRKYHCCSRLFSMTLTDKYVQIDSGYEKLFAEYLTDNGRTFKKPLINDESETKPDFILTDTGSQTFIEVWGMVGNEDYETRKQEKIEIYSKQGIPLISWTPITDETLPSLPKSRK